MKPPLERASDGAYTALANGESIDFEAENQKISDQIQSETDKLLAKVLDDASSCK